LEGKKCDFAKSIYKLAIPASGRPIADGSTNYKIDADNFFKESLSYKGVSLLFGTLTKYFNSEGNKVGLNFENFTIQKNIIIMIE